MHIEKVQLRNFQKHESLDVVLGDGVNVIYGETGAGKSCVIRAIRWVIFNDPKGDVVRKEGSTETSVKVLLSDGTELERLKSEKVNSYALTKMGLRKEFNAIGKVIPQEIVDAIGIYPMQVDKDQLILNIAKQISLPFLLNESGAFRMKVFNKLTGNNILDHVIQGLNKDTRSLSKTKKLISAELETKEAQHNVALLEHKRIQPIYQGANDLITIVAERSRALDMARELIDRQQTAIANLESAGLEYQNIKHVDDSALKHLGENVGKHSEAKLYFEKILELSLFIEDIGKQKFKVIDKGKVEKVSEMVSQFYEVQIILGNLVDYKGLMDQFNQELADCIGTQVRLSDEYREEFKKAKNCPTCKQTISQEYAEAIEV